MVAVAGLFAGKTPCRYSYLWRLSPIHARKRKTLLAGLRLLLGRQGRVAPPMCGSGAVRGPFEGPQPSTAKTRGPRHNPGRISRLRASFVITTLKFRIPG